MRTSLIPICAVAAVTLATGPFGCSRNDRSLRLSIIPDTHLIFNPEWTGIPSDAIARADWPVAHVYDSTSEIVHFRTTMIDRQTHSARGRDQLTRTFLSVRRGSARR